MLLFLYFQAKMLAEMDEEFGIGSLVQDQMKQEKQEVKSLLKNVQCHLQSSDLPL